MEKEDFDFAAAYSELEKKYGLPEFLPEFQKMAEDFDIEKTPEKEPLFLIREIRRAISEKLSAYMHLFETLINPSATPMFIFSILRGIKEEDKELIKKIYKRFTKLQIKVLKLDTIYSEKDEVEFIKTTFNEWQDLKKTIYNLIEKFDENVEKGDSSEKRGYFG